MTWFKGIGLTEIIFLAMILIAYLGYYFRLRFISSYFKSSNSGFFKKLPLRIIYLTLIFISLLGPSFGNQTREIKVIGKDIFIAVDLSKSMDARDVKPSRLEKAKFEIQRILDEFNSDRVGLIIFSSEAFVQCPLTYDQSALNLFIETLNTELVPHAGTELNEPLEMALEKLTEDQEGTGKTQAQTIVLISDGEDFGENSEKVVKKIKAKGIKLFCLGIGTDKGSTIPRGRGKLTDEQGKEVITRLNREGLKRLAIKTGGKYYEISDGINEIGKLINSINKIEGELKDTRQVDASSNKFMFFLIPALILAILDVFFTSRTIRI
jgi:Ca-activated chloride channel homolog